MMRLFQLLNLYNTKIGLLIVEVYTFCHYIKSNNNNNNNNNNNKNNNKCGIVVHLYVYISCM